MKSSPSPMIPPSNLVGNTSTPIRHEDFWFEDGHVVLSVTEDGTEHHFRVHRTILTIASPVFHDMLSMPRPSGHESLLVPLQDDSVQDLTALLGILYISRKTLTVTFDVALAILRLSHKYQIEGLQQMMKAKLQEDWPLKHSAYLARLAYLGSPGNRIPQAMKLIDTAQRCRANELLPTAFYELACAWGTQWQDIAGDLTPENATRLWAGRARSEQRLRSFVVDSSEALMWKHSPSETIFQHRANFASCKGCLYGLGDTRDICPDFYPALRKELSGRLFDGVYGFTALLDITRRVIGKFCIGCQEWSRSVLENKAQELWESIPADFDLPEVDSGLYSESHS